MNRNKIKIIVLAVIGIVSITTIVLSMQVEAPKDDFQNAVPISLKEENFSYDEVTNAYKKAKDNGEFEQKRKPENTNLYAQEEDSMVLKLQQQITLLEQRQKGTNVPVAPINNGTVQQQPTLSEAQKEALYRAELLKAREERLARSQDYSAPQEIAPVDSSVGFLEFNAAVYRDQFILPGDRITLILTQPVTYKGNVFKKNTFVYAIAHIQGARVMMNVTNLDHVPVSLVAKDVTDGSLGMYSERAGQLWREFNANAQSNGINDVTGEIAQRADVPLVGTAIRAFGQFFRTKKYREKDKILLVDNDQLILTTPLN